MHGNHQAILSQSLSLCLGENVSSLYKMEQLKQGRLEKGAPLQSTL